MPEGLGLGRKRPRERHQARVDRRFLDRHAPAAQRVREVRDGAEHGEAVLFEVVGRERARVGAVARHGAGEADEKAEERAEGHVQGQIRRDRLDRALHLADELRRAQLGLLGHARALQLLREGRDEPGGLRPAALQLVDLDLVARDAAQLGRGRAEAALEGAHLGARALEGGALLRDLAAELADVGLAIRARTRQVEAAGGDGRADAVAGDALALGAQARQLAGHLAEVGVGVGVAAELGVAEVDLVDERLELGDLLVDLGDLAGRRRDRGGGFEPLRDRGELGFERAQARLGGLHLDARGVEAALELRDLADAGARLGLEPGGVVRREVGLELGLDLAQLALAARHLLVQKLARGAHLGAVRLAGKLAVLAGVDGRDERGLVGAPGARLDPDGVDLLAGGRHADDLALEVVRQPLGRRRALRAGLGGGLAHGRQRERVGPGEQRGGGAVGHGGRLLEHERLVEHLAAVLSGHAHELAHHGALGTAGAVAVDEQHAVGLVDLGRPQAVGERAEPADERAEQDEAPVAAQHAALVARGVARLGARRRPGRRRRARQDRRQLGPDGHEGRRGGGAVVGDAEAGLLVVGGRVRRLGHAERGVAHRGRVGPERRGRGEGVERRVAVALHRRDVGEGVADLDHRRVRRRRLDRNGVPHGCRLDGRRRRFEVFEDGLGGRVERRSRRLAPGAGVGAGGGRGAVVGHRSGAGSGRYRPVVQPTQPRRAQASHTPAAGRRRRVGTAARGLAGTGAHRRRGCRGIASGETGRASRPKSRATACAGPYSRPR